MSKFDLGAPSQEALDDFAAWIDEMEQEAFIQSDFDDFINDEELENEGVAA